MGKCDKSRSIAVGFMTALVMGLILLLWFGVDVIRQTTIKRTDIFVLFVLLWFIGASMDYFNQCYTVCSNLKSSVKYGIFVVTLIYLLFIIFVDSVQISMLFEMKNFIVYLLNITIITGLHYVTCEVTHKSISDK
jgi:hypothetical protein